HTRALRGARKLPSQWSAAVSPGLYGLGWPGDRKLDSGEYQALQKWREVLAELARLDAIVGRIGYRELCGQLARIVNDTPFQPESDEGLVQILGVLESAGLEFEHLFVTGLHDEAWPQAPRPNPFLPAALQRAHDLPHSNAQWELQFARRMCTLWRGAADHVIFTSPTREGDRILRPSPMLHAFEGFG